MIMIRLFGRLYGRFILRTFTFVGLVAVLIVGTQVLYDGMFVRFLEAQTLPAASLLQTRGQLDDETRNTIIRSAERVDQLTGRVTVLEQVRGDLRLSLIESKLDTQSWFLKIIFGGAIVQIIAGIGKGVTWVSKQQDAKKGRSF